MFAVYIYRSNSYLKLYCVDDVFTQIPFDHSVVTITQVWKLISGIIHHLIHHTHYVFVCATYTLQ